MYVNVQNSMQKSVAIHIGRVLTPIVGLLAHHLSTILQQQRRSLEPLQLRHQPDSHGFQLPVAPQDEGELVVVREVGLVGWLDQVAEA